jgi:hypothetical protein
VWVNAAPESYYRFTFSIAFVVNDVAIALSFGLMTKEWCLETVAVTKGGARQKDHSVAGIE